MPDRLFSDSALAELYDAFCGDGEERADFRFYLPMVMSAQAVLDVGCGTGALLHRAREAGHTGRLCGLDPAPGMLEQARKRSDVEWILGELGSAEWDREFDLVVMSGHAFQVLLTDEELDTAFTAVRRALCEDGRFAFETRNPLAREWERWSRIYAAEVTGPSGACVRMETRVDSVEGEFVRFSHSFTSRDWQAPQRSQSCLRFLDRASLASFLSASGLTIEQQFGDFDRSPLSAKSPEIVTVARRA